MQASRPAVECEFAALDFESAGALRGATDVPVQVGWGVLRGGAVDPSASYRSYLRAERPVTWAARRTHGISDADLEGAPRMLDLWPRFREAFRGRVMVAHGRGTEQRFLRAFPAHGFAPWVDTLQLARGALPGLASYALADVVAACGAEERLRALCPAHDWHDALFDALACLVVIERVLADFPGLPLGALLEPDASAHYRRTRPRQGPG